MSSAENIQNFHKTALKIKKYIIGKEKEEILAIGKFLVDVKYLIEKECNINIINQTNINVNININNSHNGENEKRTSLISIKKEIKPENKPIIIIDKAKKDNPNILLENNKKIIEKNEKSEKSEKNEIFQIIDYKELINKEEIIQNEKKNIYDTFCIGVFITGLSSPIQLTSIIEKSDNFKAQCGHSECSMFPSIEPDLINTYINKNSNNFQELSQLVSYMCFPLGIKPCFGCKFNENKIENSPDPQKTQQTFFNIITNEKNECYYIATLQYFIKMTNNEYIMKYRFNPVTYLLDKIKSMNNKDKKFKINMKNISNLLNNLDVLIPESISLISKYPYFTSMEKCLRCLISLKNKEDMDNLINHLINEVPSPKKGYQIQFFIPRIEKPIIVNHQYNPFLTYTNNENILNNGVLSSSQINMKILLDKIEIENIIMIFQLLILEQKILFLENNYQTLSEISSVFLELIYPLVWINPFVPVLSTKTVRFLQSPVPFVMGIDEYLLKYSIASKFINPINNSGSDIIIFDIMTNHFISSKTLKRTHKKDIFKEFKLPIMQSKIREFIEKELKYIKKQIKDENEIDKEIRNVFLKSMIMLMGDYNNFIFYTEDEIPLFSKDAFIQSHKEKSSQCFLFEMTRTQIFNQFLLNEKLIHTKTKISNEFEIIDTSYFKRLIAKNQNLVNSEKIRNRAFSTKKIKKSKKNKVVSFEENDINNYLKKNNKENDKIKENELKDNNMMDGYSVDFSKGKNHFNINPNENISGAFSEKNNEENPIEKMNKEKKLMSRAKSDKRIINLKNKKDESPEKKDLNLEQGTNIKIAVLYPYFVPKTCNNIEEISLENIKNEIDKYSKKNNLKLLILDSGHVFIRHSFRFNNINQKRIYLLPNNNDERNSNKKEKRNSLDNKIKVNKIDNNFNKINNDNKKDENIKEINQKDIKLIKETFIRCYTNKNRISKEDLNIIGKIFLNEENKKFFAKLILPDIKMKKEKYHKLLTPSSFDDLSKLLHLSLEHLTSNEYNTCRLLTISSFVYYKIENKKIVYLYENFIRGIKSCRLWLTDEFWSNFFKLEYEEELKYFNDSFYKRGSIISENYNSVLDNDQTLLENEKEKIYFETISFTVKIMIKLKLSKKFILNTFSNKIFNNEEIEQEKIDFFTQHISEIFNKL